MGRSRWVICFTLLTLCLAPFSGWDGTQTVYMANDDRPWTVSGAVPGSENTDTPVKAIPCVLEKSRTTLVSQALDGTLGDDNSYDPSISADGRFIAFFSLAHNLVIGFSDTSYNVLIHDRLSGET